MKHFPKAMICEERLVSVPGPIIAMSCGGEKRGYSLRSARPGAAGISQFGASLSPLATVPAESSKSPLERGQVLDRMTGKIVISTQIPMSPSDARET